MADKTSNSVEGTNSHQNRYLVAWGGDKRSQDALKLGEVMARTFDAKLDIVYVVQHATNGVILSAADSSYEEQVGKEARGWLKKAAKSVGKGVDVETHVAHDTSITHGILRTAQTLGTSLIVIGAGSGAGQPVATNPIVGGLLHASPVPIAMAPRNYRKVKFDSLTSLSAAIGPRPGAQQIVTEAAEGVSRVGLPLNLISLVALNEDKSVHVDGFDEAERLLAETARRVSDRVDVTTQVGQGRSLKHAVKKMKWDERTALMVGSSRLARGRTTFLGTTATRMLAALPVPMIIVPRPEGN